MGMPDTDDSCENCGMYNNKWVICDNCLKTILQNLGITEDEINKVIGQIMEATNE